VAYKFGEIAVLIVDSQPAVIDLIRGSMRLLGVKPENLYSFGEGRMALNVVKDKKPELIIADWEMIDIKGLEFIKAVRGSDINPYVPIIFMTSLTTEKRVSEARDSGITEFLAKPFTARTLCEKIEAIVEKPRQFVMAPDYRGPDRRRKSDAKYLGTERREPRKIPDLVISEADVFKAQKKVRSAQLLTPPNIMKKKMGSGGVDVSSLAAAESLLSDNTVDFKPIGMAFVHALEDIVSKMKQGGLKDGEAIEFLLYPAAQLKAQGNLFHYPVITRIADILVHFLETIEKVDKEVFEIIEAHRTAFIYVLNNAVKGHGVPHEKKLQASLLDACDRYYKSRKL
jgi:two-component system, chemotaxis family, chemotaxis protein CheY